MVKQKAVYSILSMRKFLRFLNLSLEAKLILYIAFIHSIDIYASPARCTILQTQFDILEPIQKHALQYITQSPFYLFILTLRNSA